MPSRIYVSVMQTWARVGMRTWSDTALRCAEEKRSGWIRDRSLDMADEALSGWEVELQWGVDIAVVAAVVVGADLEIEIETEMMRGEGRADDGLLRGDGHAPTVHNIYYALVASHCVVFYQWIDPSRVYADAYNGFLMEKPKGWQGDPWNARPSLI
jgi:hypothetical protein